MKALGMRVAIGVSAVGIIALLAGCSSEASSSSEAASSSKPDTAAATSAAPSPASSGSGLDSFNAQVSDLIARKQGAQTTAPPATGPAAQTGKKLFVVPCAMIANGCAASATAAEAAAKQIGWDVTLIDPAGDPVKQNNAVETAISQGADGIYLTAIDYKTVAKSVAKAQESGIKVVCFACSDPEGKYDALVPTSPKDAYDEGYLAMAALYEATSGDLKVIMVNGPEYGIGSDVNGRQEGAEAFVSECQAAGGSCEIAAKEDILTANFTTTVPAQIVSSVRQHPEANAIWSFADPMYAFIQPALEKAGIDLPISGIDPTEFNLDLLRNGKQYGSVAVPFDWVGYAGIDNLNRMFAGEEPVDQGVVGQLITSKNVPASGEYKSDIDVASAYKTLWGLDG